MATTNFADIENYLLSKYDFRHNPVLERTEFKLKGKKNSIFILLSERDVNTLFRELNLNNIKITISTLRSLLNSEFIIEQNPFEEYFTSLPKWSNKEPDYIEQLAQTVTAENDTFWKWAFKKWLVNLVACALESTETAKKLKIKSGINQQVLVFVGQQGIGKTTWLNNLLPANLEGYLYSGIVNPSNKDTLVSLSENLIINLDELENLNKTELGSLKSLITLSAIRLRRSYGIYNENYVRRASFVGSVNEAEFLTDTTGNRRYLVIETTTIDYKHKVAMDNVYSQAYYLYQTNLKKNRFEFEFKRDDIIRIDENNNKYLRQSIEEELLLKYYRLPEKEDNEKAIINLTPTEIINELMENPKIKIRIGDPSSLRRLGNALHKHQFQKISKVNSKPYQLVRVFTSGEGEDNTPNETVEEDNNGIEIETENYGIIKLNGKEHEVKHKKSGVGVKFKCSIKNGELIVEIIAIGMPLKEDENKFNWWVPNEIEVLLTGNEENIKFAQNLKTNFENVKAGLEKIILKYLANK